MGECTVNLKGGQVKIYILIADNHYVYIHRIVWDLSLSVVIVCILWMAFFSGRLHWIDHYRSSGMTVWAHLPLLCKLIFL